MNETFTLICTHCGAAFEGNKWKYYRQQRGENVYCSENCKYDHNGFKKRPLISKCLYCGKDLPREKAWNKFCNTSCSAKYNNEKRKSTYDYSKQSNSLKIRHMCEYGFDNLSGEDIKKLSRQEQENLLSQYNNHLKERDRKRRYIKRQNKKPSIKKCSICGKEFQVTFSQAKTCSEECRRIAFQQAGRKGVKSRKETKRSKNEILFANLCLERFNILTNEPIFNGWDADVILPDIRVAVLWNGKWHYEKITEKHSLKQVQNRDRIKIKEIEKRGYTPYVIQDMGKYNPSFVKEQFALFLERFHL